MKKILLIIAFYVLFTTVSILIIRDNRPKFYLLNWGEYIDPDLLEQFETIHNVSVVMDEVSSSEDMYQKIKAATTKYDVAIPGDYIIEKMATENLLYEIDTTYKNSNGDVILSNHEPNMFHDDLEELRDNYFVDNQKYAMPYFWGAYSILYSTRNEEVEKVVLENGFDVFFNRNLFDTDIKIGMYDVPRWAVSAYLLNNKMDVNTSDLSSISNDFIDKVSRTKPDLWGNDILKKQIAAGNLDIAFVQLGDFFDQLYITEISFEEVLFNAFIPDYTAAFYDGLVIPKTCENYELALEFINFFLDPENAYDNACYVGYSPTIKKTIELIIEDEDFAEMLEMYPFYLNPIQGKEAQLFRNLEGSYAYDVIELVNRAKNR